MADEAADTTVTATDIAGQPPESASTYEDLESQIEAQVAVSGEVEAPPETASTEAAAEEPTQPGAVDDEHPTKLGRKVKDLTEKFDTLMSKFDTFMTSQKPGEAGGDVAAGYSDDVYDQMCAIEPPPVDYIATPKDQVLIHQWEQRCATKMHEASQRTYQSAYLKKAAALEADGGELHKQILSMITTDKSPYNVVNIGRGDVDAEINYHKAHKALLTGKTKGESFGKGETTRGTGVTAPTTKEAPAGNPVQLDKQAMEYANYLGMDEATRTDALSRKTAFLGR